MTTVCGVFCEHWVVTLFLNKVLSVTYSIHYRTDSFLLDALKFITKQIHWFYIAEDSLQNKFINFKYLEIHYRTNSLVLRSWRFIAKRIPCFYIVGDSLQNKFIDFKYPEIYYQTNPLLLHALKFMTEQMADLPYPKFHY